MAQNLPPGSPETPLSGASPDPVPARALPDSPASPHAAAASAPTVHGVARSAAAAPPRRKARVYGIKQHIPREDPHWEPTAPRRPPTTIAATIALGLAAAAGVFLIGRSMWVAIQGLLTFREAVAWTRWLSDDFALSKWGGADTWTIAFVAASLVLAACVTGLTAMTAYNTWHGWRWARRAAIVVAASSLVLSLVFSWWGLLSAVPAVVGAVLVWLAPSRRYADLWQAERTPVPPARLPVPEVRYGPLPKYRHRPQPVEQSSDSSVA